MAQTQELLLLCSWLRSVLVVTVQLLVLLSWLLRWADLLLLWAPIRECKM
jgi:hypothetical protein